MAGPAARRLLRLTAGATLLVLAAGCSSATSSSGTATGRPSAGNSGIVPPSLTPSPASARQVRFGQGVEVVFRPNRKQTRLRLTVTVVRAGRLRDLSAYSLDQQAQASRPYYVRVSVTNLGPDDVGGTLLPLWATTSAGAVVAASSFTQPFSKCRSTPLPSSFAKGASTQTCLLYLVPRSATLESLTNRTAAGDVAVTWTGTVKPPRER